MNLAQLIGEYLGEIIIAAGAVIVRAIELRLIRRKNNKKSDKKSDKC